MARKKYKDPRQSKKLSQKSQLDLRPHYDKVNDIFADEHYLHYLVVKNAKSEKRISNRLYISYSEDKEFYETYYPKIHGSINKSFDNHSNKLHLFTIFPEHKNYISKLVFELVDENLSRKTVENVLKGFSFFIEVMLENNISLPNIDNFEQMHQKLVHRALETAEISKSYKNYISTFFSFISKKNKQFRHKNISSRQEGEIGIEGLSLDTVFTLDFCASNELDLIISRVNEYKSWINEFASTELFSLENLAYTYFKNREELGRIGSAQNKILNKLSIALHKVNLQCWTRSKGKTIYYYASEDDRKRHAELSEIKKKGVDIGLNSEKMFALWHHEICPNWPHDQEMLPIFSNIWTYGMTSWRSNQAYRLNISLVDFDSRIYPSMHEFYPLALFLLIRLGTNQDVLKSWSIRKEENHYLMGDNINGLALLVQGLKGRGNTVQDIVIPANSEEEKYIKFYLNWLYPLYEKSTNNKFFQYITQKHQNNNISCWDKNTFDSLKQGKNKFYMKYEIFDDKGKRIYFFDHRRIRVSSNYADYLRGYSEFQRQRNKGHKSVETQRHYENNTDWKGQVRYKISKTQEKIVKIFRGEITENDDPKAVIFNGPIADCVNPNSPTFPNAPILKENEMCLDWTKCLTQCEQCIVIPKVHGPVISAWIRFMEKEKDQFMRNRDWEKEYLVDYESAVNVFSGFSSDQKKYSNDQASRYMLFIRNYVLSNKRIIKTKRDYNATK